MAVELGPFAVDPAQIARLGDSFTPFINQLLDIETAAAGMSGATLTTTYRVNLADGGVDAGLRHAVETRWLPAGDSAWQFKAGDRSPQKCADELMDATEALEVLRNGGKYRLVIGEGLTDQKIKNRREKLIKQAEASLGMTIDRNSDVIEVLDANALARWVQEYPYLAVSPLIGGIDTVALNFQSWAESNRNEATWVPSDSRTQLKQEIEDFIRGDAQVDLRIEGVSGLGKSRAVLEALRGTEYEALVLYVHAADDLAPNMIPRLLNQDRVEIVVIDDCGGKRHEGLAGLLPTGSRLRLITLGEPDSYGVQSPGVRLAPLDDNVIDEVLIKNQPSLWPEARRVVVEQCVGNVRWALRLAAGIIKERPNSATELLTPDAIQTYVTNALPSGSSFLACSALALFTRVGYDAELAVELDAIAEMLGFTVTELRAAARSLTDAGLLDKKGRYRSVAPHPLAVYLASIAWDEFGHKLIQALPDMPPVLAERLLRRAADVGTTAATGSIVDRLLAPGGPFSSLEELNKGNNSRLLIQVAIISPNEVTRHLADLIESASEDELRAEGGIRRNLVWALEKLVWHRRTFVEAADALLRLAIAENETFANNATGTWVDLFGARLPGTAAKPAERMQYLQRAAASQSVEVRRLVVKACGSALSTHETIMVSGENQGGVVVEPRGAPETWGELWEYHRNAIQLARSLVDDADGDVSAQALDVLKRSIHPFLEYEPVRDTLFDALASLPQSALETIWTEVHHLDGLFRRVDNVEDRVAGLDVLISRLPPPEARGNLNALAHANRWDIDVDDEGELRRRIVAEAQAMPVADAQTQLLKLLNDAQLPAAFEVGQALHAIAAGPDTIRALTDLTSETGSLAGLTGYLYGAIAAGETDAFDNYLDGDQGTSLPPETRLALSVRGPRTDVGWERVLALAAQIPVHQAAPRLFGWHVKVEVDRLIALLRSWLPRIESQQDYNVAVDFFAMALHSFEGSSPELDDLIARLVEGLSKYPATGQQSWDWAQLAKRQIASSPDGLLRTLLDLMDRGALTMHAGGHEAEILQEVVREMGASALAPVLDLVLGGSWRVEMDVRGWLINEFEPDAVIAWIGDDLARARVAASVTGVPEAGPPTDLVRYLLVSFNGDPKIASSLQGDYISGMWTGNESIRLAGQIAHLSTWLESPEPEGVKKWAKGVVAGLEARRKAVLQEEAEEER